MGFAAIRAHGAEVAANPPRVATEVLCKRVKSALGQSRRFATAAVATGQTKDPTLDPDHRIRVVPVPDLDAADLGQPRPLSRSAGHRRHRYHPLRLRSAARESTHSSLLRAPRRGGSSFPSAARLRRSSRISRWLREARPIKIKEPSNMRIRGSNRSFIKPAIWPDYCPAATVG